MSDGLPGTAAAQAPKRSILLIVSLCLNVALIAMIVVGFVNGVRHARPSREFLSPRALIADASPAERAKIQAIIDAHAAKVAMLKKADRAARLAAFKLFADPQLNPVEFAKAVESIHQADDALREELTQVVVQSVTQLSAPERQTIAEKARRRYMWWRFFRGHHAE
jgi:uncharacterized membrane protein